MPRFDVFAYVRHPGRFEPSSIARSMDAPSQAEADAMFRDMLAADGDVILDVPARPSPNLGAATGSWDVCASDGRVIGAIRGRTLVEAVSAEMRTYLMPAAGANRHALLDGVRLTYNPTAFPADTLHNRRPNWNEPDRRCGGGVLVDIRYRDHVKLDDYSTNLKTARILVAAPAEDLVGGPVEIPMNPIRDRITIGGQAAA